MIITYLCCSSIFMLDLPLLFYVWIIHLKFLSHGALYFCCQRVLEKKTKPFQKSFWCYLIHTCNRKIHRG